MPLTELAALLAAASLGAMLFFSAVIAPTVFKALPEAEAGTFLRAMFPKYFTINGAVALVAAGLAMRPLESILLVICGIAMIGVTWGLIPVINDARDRMMAGDVAAKARFASTHRMSVVINLLEMIVLAVVIAMLLRA